MSEEVVLAPGSLDADVLLPDRTSRAIVAILHTAEVAGLAERARDRLLEPGLAVHTLTIPSGDQAKTLENAAAAYAWLNEIGLGRHDTVLAVGGGALTDLAGFVAATYLRGVEAVYVPTTLLAAVDAAIGGKTGLNLGGKNLVGVFAPPARVVIDLEVLAALPAELRSDGLAEALKAGLIGDPELVTLIEQQGAEAPLEDIIRRAIDVKQRVVAEDFREAGLRAILNYGHTIGHAVEYAGEMRHGPAISVGMVAAGAISERMLGFREGPRQRRILEDLGLPTTSDLPLEDVVRLIGLDKKRDATGLRMVLLEAVGAPVVRPVDEDDVRFGLAAVGIS